VFACAGNAGQREAERGDKVTLSNLRFFQH
jgi:hypothetical protein